MKELKGARVKMSDVDGILLYEMEYIISQVIHKGWTGIHYAAALGLTETFLALFEKEYQCLIDKESSVFCQGLARLCLIEAGSSVAHIAVACD